MRVTVLGLRLLLHPSWIVVLALIVVSLAAVGLPGRPGLGEPLRWLLGLALAPLFLGSVVLHELAHAAVMRQRGIEPPEITLLVFGAAAGLEKQTADARSEVLIALGGPSVNLLVGGVLLLASSLVGRVTEPVGLLVVGLAWWLGLTNLLLALVNLVPAFPMDGGRLLRALLWSITGDFVRATRLATYVGRGLAYGLIALGLFVALGEELVVGVWLVLLGWFLNRASEIAYQRVELGMLVEDVVVGDVMERDFAVVSPNLTLDTLLDQHVLRGRAAIYPVTLDDRLVGTIDMRQVRRVGRSERPTTRVTDVMRRGDEMVTLTEPQGLMEAMLRLERARAVALPVVAEDDRRRLLGILTRDGIVGAIRQRASLRRSPLAGSSR